MVISHQIDCAILVRKRLIDFELIIKWFLKWYFQSRDAKCEADKKLWKRNGLDKWIFEKKNDLKYFKPLKGCIWCNLRNCSWCPYHVCQCVSHKGGSNYRRGKPFGNTAPQLLFWDWPIVTSSRALELFELVRTVL